MMDKTEQLQTQAHTFMKVLLYFLFLIPKTLYLPINCMQKANQLKTNRWVGSKAPSQTGFRKSIVIFRLSLIVSGRYFDRFECPSFQLPGTQGYNSH